MNTFSMIWVTIYEAGMFFCFEKVKRKTHQADGFVPADWSLRSFGRRKWAGVIEENRKWTNLPPGRELTAV